MVKLTLTVALVHGSEHRITSPYISPVAASLPLWSSALTAVSSLSIGRSNIKPRCIGPEHSCDFKTIILSYVLSEI